MTSKSATGEHASLQLSNTPMFM